MARTPGPANFCLFEGAIHYVADVALEPRLLPVHNTVGQVIGRDRDRGVLVKTGDSGIWECRIWTEAESEHFVPRHPLAALLRHNPDQEIVELKRQQATLEQRIVEIERRMAGE